MPWRIYARSFSATRINGMLSGQWQRSGYLQKSRSPGWVTGSRKQTATSLVRRRLSAKRGGKQERWRRWDHRFNGRIRAVSPVLNEAADGLPDTGWITQPA